MSSIAATGRPRRKPRAGAFWVGTGLGFAVSVAIVVIAAEFTYLRRQRLLKTGALNLTDDELVHDLSEAVNEGLHVLSHAATELGHTFSQARRELIRFGLDPLPTGGGGDDGHAYYFDDDMPTSEPRRPLNTSEWENDEA